jgi:Dolichyl-phosphate-mannose-protein mannosyltransferase
MSCDSVARSANEPWRTWLALAAILVVSAVARLAGLFTDLWLDEIWSVSAARQMTSVLDVFRAFPWDNNHHLNTLLLYILGDQSHWEVYRIPAFVAGVGSVVIAWFDGRKDSPERAAVASVLVGGSYLLIHFSSEARGYSLAVFFVLAAWYYLQRFAQSPNWRHAAPFWACAILAVLSQLTGVHVLVAGFAWLWLRGERSRSAEVASHRVLLRAFCVPATFVVGFYLITLRHTRIAGGPPFDLSQLLSQTVGYAVGGPQAGWPAWTVGFLVLVAVLGAILWLWRRGDDRWAFYLTASVVSPTLMLLAGRPHVLFVRYFIISATFSFLAASHALAHLVRKGGLARLGAVVLLSAFAFGNALHVVRLVRLGRGHYRDAVLYMAERTSGPLVTVASDHDFRNGTTLDYYARFLPSDKRLVYVPQAEYAHRCAEWLIVHGREASLPVRPDIQDVFGNRFALTRSWPSGELSGMWWHLYRRVEPCPTTMVQLRQPLARSGVPSRVGPMSALPGLGLAAPHGEATRAM